MTNLCTFWLIYWALATYYLYMYWATYLPMVWRILRDHLWLFCICWDANLDCLCNPSQIVLLVRHVRSKMLANSLYYIASWISSTLTQLLIRIFHLFYGIFKSFKKDLTFAGTTGEITIQLFLCWNTCIGIYQRIPTRLVNLWKEVQRMIEIQRPGMINERRLMKNSH